MLTFKGSTRYLRFQNTAFFKGAVNDYYLYKYNNLIYLYFELTFFGLVYFLLRTFFS